jgi:hypothetical protein
MQGKYVFLLVVFVGFVSYVVGSEVSSNDALEAMARLEERFKQETAPIRLAPVNGNALSDKVERSRFVLDLSGEPILGYRSIPEAAKVNGREPVIPVFRVYWAKEGIILETNFKVPGSLPGTQHRILVGGR